MRKSSDPDPAPACVLFDLDGTLCDTGDVDDECYREAVASALEISPARVDWSDAPHRSDSGIARWLWERFRSRAPTAEEQAGLRIDFVSRLESALAAAPGRFRCISGAAEFLNELIRRHVALGIGTGGWRASAELKLAAAGLDVSLLHATADDSESRTGIFTLAKSRTIGARLTTPTRTLLVGDGIWDLRTARELGWEFLGIGVGEAAEKLRRAGAGEVVADYRAWDTLMSGCFHGRTEWRPD